MKTQVLFSDDYSVAATLFVNEGGRTFAHYNHPFDQSPVDSEDIPCDLIKKIESWCEENGACLWSY